MQPDRPQPVLDARSAPTAFALRNIADHKARGRLRAAATAEAVGKGELEWLDADGWRYQLEAPPRVTISPKDTQRAAATVDLQVWDATGTLIFRDRIHAWDGFPVLVPDGTKHEETGPTGNKINVWNFRESPLEAARLDLAHTVRVVTKNGPWVKAKPGTVSTFYSETSDGLVQSENPTYSTARAGSGLTVNTVSSSLQVGQILDTGPDPDLYYVIEAFISFDTGSLSGEEVSAAVLSLFLQTDGSATDFTVNARIKAWLSGGLTTADWVAGADISGTILATLNSSGIGATGSYKDFTESGSNLQDGLNLSGDTEIMLTSSRHEAGNTPTRDERLTFRSADRAGTTEDPKLVVTHAAASVPFRRALLGVGF